MLLFTVTIVIRKTCSCNRYIFWKHCIHLIVCIIMYDNILCARKGVLQEISAGYVIPMEFREIYFFHFFSPKHKNTCPAQDLPPPLPPNPAVHIQHNNFNIVLDFIIVCSGSFLFAHKPSGRVFASLSTTEVHFLGKPVMRSVLFSVENFWFIARSPRS